MIPEKLISLSIYLGLNSKIAFPTSNYQEVNYGIGGGLFIGYSLQQTFDFNISASNTWLSSMMENYQIGSINANVKYYILRKSIKPYIGFGTGYFYKSFNGPFEENFSENGIGIIPSAGALFDIKRFKGLFLNTEISYCKVFTGHQINLIDFNVGLLYYFRNK